MVYKKDLNEIKVLIVDDSKTMCRIHQNILNQMGIHNTEMVFDGAQGFDKFFDYRPDLILTDINMPKMDGFSLIENIRKVCKDTPIFVITTEGAKEEVIKALKLGANNYLVKPTKADVLKEKIKNLLKF